MHQNNCSFLLLWGQSSENRSVLMACAKQFSKKTSPLLQNILCENVRVHSWGSPSHPKTFILELRNALYAEFAVETLEGWFWSYNNGYGSFALRSGDGLGTNQNGAGVLPGRSQLILRSTCILLATWVVGLSWVLAPNEVFARAQSGRQYPGENTVDTVVMENVREVDHGQAEGFDGLTYPCRSRQVESSVPLQLWAYLQKRERERGEFVGSAEVQSSWPEWEKACCTVVKPTPDIRATRVCQHDSSAWSGCVTSSCHESQLISGSSWSNSLPACWKLFRETKTNGLHTGAFPYLQKLIIAVTTVSW